MDHEQLFNDNIKLAHYFARKVYEKSQPRGYYEYDDLFQYACIGLWKGVKHFDESKGRKFSTFAGRIINNEMYMYMRRENKFAFDYTLQYPIHTVMDDSDDLTLQDMLTSRTDDPEADVMAQTLKELYRDIENPKLFSKNQRYRTRKRDQKIYELMVSGYRQIEMIPLVGVSQRVVALNMERIRRKVKEEWVGIS